MTSIVAAARPNLKLLALAQAHAGIRDEVLEGLRASPKRLPPKLFYDANGARLFQALCATRAYYPTRLETQILARHADGIAASIGPGAVVIEPGAGEMRKIRLLLPALRPRAYVAIDVSQQQLFDEAERLARECPWLEVTALAGDFQDVRIRARIGNAPGRPLLFFPGSTLGNFEPPQAADFLRDVRHLLGQDARCVIGIDLVKPLAPLELAYNDPEGITARFNLNLLARLNRELDADFDLAAFSHRAFYDSALQRVEMHLVSTRAQTVCVAGAAIRLGVGETIHTENSCKYRPEQFEAMAREAGFRRTTRWSDERDWFGVFLLHAVD